MLRDTARYIDSLNFLDNIMWFCDGVSTIQQYFKNTRRHDEWLPKSPNVLTVFPNPAARQGIANALSFGVTLLEPDYVDLRIYDENGRLLGNLVSGEWKERGVHFMRLLN